MKNILLISVAVALFTAVSTQADPAVSYDWRFVSNANPSAPDAAVGGTGAPQAAIAIGQFSGGWKNSNLALGTAQGIWDLGKLGTISLSNATGLAGDSSLERLITVSVVEYQDGGIYGLLAGVSVPGAQLVSSSNAIVAPAYIGNWTLDQSQWRALAGVPVNTILIAGVTNGTLVDRVTIESSFVSAPPPPQLAIRSVGVNNDQVEISWPAFYSTMTLQSVTDLAAPGSWQTVTDAVQVSGSVRSITVPASGAAHFYRLKQP
jgi:hypothetical protein